MTFYVELIKSGPGRQAVLTRSTIRPCSSPAVVLSPSILDSGEMAHYNQINNDGDIGDFGFHDPGIQDDTSSHLGSSTSEKDAESMQQNNTADDDKYQPLINHNSLETDDTIDGTDRNQNIGGWGLVLRCVQFVCSAMRILLFLRAIICQTVPFFQNCAQFLANVTPNHIIARNDLTPIIVRIAPNFYIWKNLVEIQKITKIPIIFFAHGNKFLF